MHKHEKESRPRCRTKPAMMSAQPPGELAFAIETFGGLLIHQPPTLLCSQFLLKFQSIRLLPQSIFVPDLSTKMTMKCQISVLSSV